MITLQGHLRAEELPEPLSMHYFRVGGSLREFLAGTAVEEVLDIGGWKTDSVAKVLYIGCIACGKAHGSKINVRYANAISYHGRLGLRNISQRVREVIESMLRKFGRHQLCA